MKNDFAKFAMKRPIRKEMPKGNLPYNGGPLLYNQGVDICSRACSCCWDIPCPTTTEQQIPYLGKRVIIGHTSVLEHSNIVTYMQIPTNANDDLIEFMAACKYIGMSCKHGEKYDMHYLIIFGSYRAYSDIYKNIKNLDNIILRYMSSCLSSTMPKEFLYDIEKDGAINTDHFSYVKPDEGNYSCRNLDVDENIHIVNVDSVDTLKQKIGIWCPEPELFNIWDLMPMLTITVLFRHMSRTCTHQLVRHRNGITQESQRYVDYTKARFASPDKFKPEKYDSEHIYEIAIDGHIIEATLRDLGCLLQDVYGQLKDPELGDYALLKEDARAYLPSNTECDKIYITFNFRNFFMFLKLREDKAAQAEIRLYATTLGEWFRKTFPDMNQEFMDYMLQPNYAIDPDPVEKYTTDIGIKIPDETYISAMINNEKKMEETNT